MRDGPEARTLMAAAVALGILTVAVETDVGAHARDRQEHTDLAAVGARRAASQLHLEKTTYVEAVMTNHRAISRPR